MSEPQGDETARIQPPADPRAQLPDQAQVQPWAMPAQNSHPYIAPVPGQMQYRQVQPHSPGLAVAASFFVPGLGSMLNERVGKGILILVLAIIAWASAIFLIGFLLGPAVWIWGMVTANNDAHRWNRAHGILS